MNLRNLIPSIRPIMAEIALKNARPAPMAADYGEAYLWIDAMLEDLAEAVSGGRSYAVARELRVDSDFSYPSRSLHEKLACLKPKPEWLSPWAEVFYRFCQRYGLQPCFGRVWPNSGMSPLYINWNLADVKRWLAESDTEFDDYPDIVSPLPQERKDYDLDLALLQPGTRKYKGRVRTIAENGLMIQFRAAGQHFEGIAPFSIMESDVRARRFDKQWCVEVTVFKRRDSNWQIPVLKVVSGGESVAKPSAEKREPSWRQPTAPCVQMELTDKRGYEHLQSRVLTGLQLSRCVLIGFGTDGTTTRDGKTKGTVTVSGAPDQIAVFMREMNVFGTEIITEEVVKC